MLADLPLGETELSRIEGVRFTKVTASISKVFRRYMIVTI